MVKLQVPTITSRLADPSRQRMLARLCSSSSIELNLDHLGGLAAYKTIDHQLVHVNQMYLDYIGFKKSSEVEGKTDSDLVWAKYAEIYHQHENDVSQSIVYSTIQPSTDKEGRFFCSIIISTHGGMKTVS